MRSLQRPDVDDAIILDTLTSDRRLNAAVTLSPIRTQLRASYDTYVVVRGDVHQIQALAPSDRQAGELRRLYGRPPSCLRYITELREQSAHDTCAMCGGMHVATIDHVLPKETFPEFSVFSANLVPACTCNSRRGAAVSGLPPSERVLHPYFDAVLSRRLVTARFSDLGEVARIEVQPLVRRDHPMASAVGFHIEHVLRRNRIHAYLVKEWARLVTRPSLVVPDLRDTPASLAQLEQVLRAERDRQDARHQSKNSWPSVFISGLLYRGTLRWLYRQLNAPGRPSDGPLIPGAT